MPDNHFIERTACPVCRSKEFKTLFSCWFLDEPIKSFVERTYLPQGNIEFSYLENAQFTLVECGRCSVVLQKYIPDDALLNKLYQEWMDPAKAYERFKKLGNLPRLSRLASEIMILTAFFGKLPHKLACLDFGMAWGRWCKLANAFEWDVRGAELSQPMVAHARSEGVAIVDWADIPKHQFDFINTEQVFEHLSAPLDTLTHLAKGLKPGGLIKISVPNGGDIKRRLRANDWSSGYGSKNFMGLVYPLAHINCFNHRSLLKMAEAAGLVRKKIPVTLQYAFATHWRGLKQILRNLAWPVYQNYTKKSTYLFFSHRKDE